MAITYFSSAEITSQPDGAPAGDDTRPAVAPAVFNDNRVIVLRRARTTIPPAILKPGSLPGN